ncbi:very short patch repair endonuclease [Elizabethkingia anophelis]|uniref:very short patch repair endonuclease n=1 Tax=Elizabethkingia anophelis TaxID=1117645 RepID=UPI0020B2953E|nr:very short patch repair endonuclease [Elizabethkingia anophelis]MDV3956693.1 very short patch repair endonuclease [Elizabethkingia anophelis]UTF92777.1 very short patch repair endonuclease [Elizabethkingia anophelis]
MDVHTPQQRSRNMRAIKSTGTKAELQLGKALWHLGYRYRKNDKTIFGKPDFSFKKYKLAIFVDSEFFHGKDWDIEKHRIKTNTEFWHKKIERNIERDREVTQYLEKSGWRVLRFWEKDIRNNTEKCITEIKTEIKMLKI